MGIKKDEVTGTWTAWYSKRHPLTRLPMKLLRKGLRSEAEAKRVQTQLIFEIEEKIRKKLVPTWWECVEEYFKHARLNGIHEKTIQNYQLGLQAYTKPVWSEKLIDEIAAGDIMALLNKELAGKSNTTKVAVLKYIRAVLKYCMEAGYIKSNPCPQPKLEVKQKVKKGLTEAQVKKLLEAARQTSSEWYYHWSVAIYTGLRSGELYSLSWDKVDLENRRIIVDCAWNKVDGFKSTKSGDERVVEISPTLLTILKELKISDPATHFVLPRLPKWEKGDQARELRFFLAGLGLPQIRFHDLRATTCSLLLGRGVPIFKVMAMLGWKDLKTASIYLRMSGETIRGITDGFDLHDPNVALNGDVLYLRNKK